MEITCVPERDDRLEEWKAGLRSLPPDDWVKIRILAECDSTSVELKRMAERGAEGRSAVLALFQTGGRGRYGRRWYSPDGKGVYVSVLERPGWGVDEAVWAGVAAATAVAAVLEEVGIADVRIKPPNDIIVGAAKIAGILVEPRAGRSGLEFIVTGVGINVTQDEADFRSAGLAAGQATSCRLLGSEVAAVDIACRFLEAWRKKFDLAEEVTVGRRELLNEWTARGGGASGALPDFGLEWNGTVRA